MAAEPASPNDPPVANPLPARPRTPRLPGMDAASFAPDMNWRRGVAFLWLLVALTAVGEGLNAALYLLAGYAGYPAPADVTRLCLEGALFVALWLGWGWLRWPLAVIAFFQGGWLILWTVAARFASPVTEASTSTPVAHGIDSIPPLFLGIVYLTLSFYLAFSVDVLDFLRHRREEGRRWVVLPIVLLIAAYLITLFNAQPIYLHWLNHEKNAALDFAMQSLRAMSAQWDPEVYANRADPDVLATWPDADRSQTFASMRPLGPCMSIIRRKVSDHGSAMDKSRGGFVVDAECDLGRVQFTHGTAQFSLIVHRTFFGPWQLGQFVAGDFQFDAPAAAPH